MRAHCLAVVSLLVGQVAAQVTLGTPRIMQGPMVGAVDEHSARLWMRLSADVAATVVYGRDPTLAGAVESAPVVASGDRDRCVEIVLKDLEPGTRYYWEPRVQGAADKYLGGSGPFTFRTAPPRAGRFRLAFGSCARIQADPEQAIWKRVVESEPDVFFWLGDNVYADTTDPDVLAEEYRRQRDVPSLQRLLHSVPHLAIWDDHDFGLNNHDGSSPMREPALEVFRRYWANPAYGLPEAPGVFFRWTYGGVDLFCLDGRSYRDPNARPDDDGKTMLGTAQFAWLTKELAASRAPFKVLVSGSGWSQAKGPGGDAWSSFLSERNRLFDWLTAHEVTGVVLLSGDTHVAELNCIPWSERGGYDLYDLVSSPLAQLPERSWIDRHPEVRIRPVWARGVNFGRIDFDLTTADPTLTFQVVGIDGRGVYEPFVLRASELAPGVSSWRKKIDAGELRAWERRRAVEARGKR